MSSQDPSISHEGWSTQYSIFKNDNLTLAAKSANISIENAVQLMDDSSQQGSVFERHVFCLTSAYSEVDDTARSVGISQDTAVHAKSLYTQVYNYSDFDQHDFQHDTLIAACVYIACREKSQPRTMPEVFKSTHATTQNMLTECETLKAFLAVLPETRSLLIKANKRLQFACREIDTLSNSNGIPLHASDQAKRLYKQIRSSESFKDQDHKPIIASCLLIACRQLNLPQNFAIDTGKTNDHIARTLKALELSYKAKKIQKIMATLETQKSVTSTEACFTDSTVHTIQEMIERLDLESDASTVHTIQQMIKHLDLESDTSTTNQQNASVRAGFEPTGPTLASIATSEDDDTKTGISTAPNAPFTVEKAYPFYASDNDNIIITSPPTGPAKTAGRKNARAMRKTLYNVICCQCKKILNLQNVHYTFQCVSCKHKRCNDCTTEPIPGTAK